MVESMAISPTLSMMESRTGPRSERNPTSARETSDSAMTVPTSSIDDQFPDSSPRWRPLIDWGDATDESEPAVPDRNQVFLSYRRADGQALARLLAGDITQRF